MKVGLLAINSNTLAYIRVSREQLSILNTYIDVEQEIPIKIAETRLVNARDLPASTDRGKPSDLSMTAKESHVIDRQDMLTY